MRVTGIDHLVLDVDDIERSLRFYAGTLGLPVEGLDDWRAGRRRFPSLRVNANTIIDLFAQPRSGNNVDHICLVVDPLDWHQVIDSQALPVQQGPVSRSGARGTGQSVYLEDPDGNTVELRYYPTNREN